MPAGNGPPVQRPVGAGGGVSKEAPNKHDVLRELDGARRDLDAVDAVGQPDHAVRLTAAEMVFRLMGLFR
jgi:hypothetical protein